MFFVLLLHHLLFATLLSSTAGSPVSDDLNALGSSEAVGWDVFSSEPFSTVNGEPVLGTAQTISQSLPQDDALFTEDSFVSSALDNGDLTVSPGLSTTLVISEQGTDGDMFGTATLDDGLPDAFLGSDEPMVGANNPSVDLAGGCVPDVIGINGKRKRVTCPNPELEDLPGSKKPSLEEEPTPRPGYDEPGMPQITLCSPGYQALCCSGTDGLGLVQTGCAECRILLHRRTFCRRLFLLVLTCAHRFTQQLQESRLL